VLFWYRSQRVGTVCWWNLKLEVFWYLTPRIGKGKVHPRTGHEGPEGEQRYSSTLSLTSALDEAGWATPRPDGFTPGKDPVLIV
jgi:hypothetical protein